jgi:hypothetical protein
VAERKTKEQAQFEAYLRAKRAYEKKMQDIDWNYDEFVPLLEDYKAGRLQIDIKKPAFELEVGDAEGNAA